MKTAKGFLAFSRNFERERLSDWAIHALDRAGREDEIIPLCEVEAKKTENYKRLVDRLVAARRYEEAEHWIGKGIRATKDNLPGIADGLRQTLQKIRTRQKNWPAVAAIKVEAFVRYPSRQAFTDCKTAAEKVRAWPEVREALLAYLEKGDPPWKREHWPLPKSGLDAPETGRKREFPRVADLIGIAIVEKTPERILFWYDRLPEKRYGSYGVDDNEVATAVQAQDPERAVAIWQGKAERLIAQVKPKAYEEAGGYLRKAARLMVKEGKQAEWNRYLQRLRGHHARKIRLMAVLDGLDDNPIIKKRR